MPATPIIISLLFFWTFWTNWKQVKTCFYWLSEGAECFKQDVDDFSNLKLLSNIILYHHNLYLEGDYFCLLSYKTKDCATFYDDAPFFLPTFIVESEESDTKKMDLSFSKLAYILLYFESSTEHGAIRKKESSLFFQPRLLD